MDPPFTYNSFNLLHVMKKMILLAATMAATLPGIAQTDTIQYRTFQGYLNPHERGTIHIPDILGYRTIKADLHLHTHQSDGGVAPYFRAWEAYQEGLDAIALTDHQPTPRYNKNPDGNISHLQAVKDAEDRGITLIRGAELTSMAWRANFKDVGHLNLLFTTDNNRYFPRTDDVTAHQADSVLAVAQADSVWVTANHPGWPDKDSEFSQWLIGQIKKGRVHGVEIFNDFEFYPRAIDYVYDYNLTPIGATDCHWPIAWRFDLKRAHRPMTLIFARDNSVAAIREALFARRSVAYSDNTLAGRKEYVEPLLRASVTAEKTGRTRKGKIEVALKNVSDIPYSFADPATNRLMVAAPLTTTYVWMDDAEMKHTWLVRNIYIRPDKHLEIQPLSLQR